MTDKLRNFFNIPDDEKVVQIRSEESVTKQVFDDAQAALSNIEQALSGVVDLDESDQDMDEIATLATTKFEEMADFAMQVDSRFAAPLFEVAQKLLGHALTAKTAKMNKKLKMLDLQLKQLAIEKKMPKEPPEDDESTLPQSFKTMDRNELLRAISPRKS